jgi:lipoprotein-anchoring transpeptidase ErfK/SrfK
MPPSRSFRNPEIDGRHPAILNAIPLAVSLDSAHGRKKSHFTPHVPNFRSCRSIPHHTVKHLPVLAILAAVSLSAARAQQPTPEASPAPAAQASPATAPDASASVTPAQSPAATPTAETPHAQPVGSQELVTRLQIFLDQQNFGPGIIDGRWGEFTGKALVHYARAHNLQVTPAIYGQLPLDTVYPIYTDYTITAADEKTVGTLPTKQAEQAKLKYMPYPDLLTFVEERYHASPDFLKKLNPGKNLDDLKAGVTLRVPNVAPFKLEDIKDHKLPDRPEFALRSIFISVEDKMLDLYDGPRLIASFPITPGSKALPAPPGKWTIIGMYTLPEFRWDEAMLYHGRRSANFFEIPPGPRNPVGILWCGLDKIGIGIHGTSTPETIGRAASHGCIRLANWDAIKFSTMVTTGMPVTIE